MSPFDTFYCFVSHGGSRSSSGYARGYGGGCGDGGSDSGSGGGADGGMVLDGAQFAILCFRDVP